jgi:carboxyl-terminal processing protease
MNEKQDVVPNEKNMKGERTRAGGRMGTIIVTAAVTMLVTFVITLAVSFPLFRIMGAGSSPTGSSERLSFSFAPDPDTEQALSKLQTVYQAITDHYYKEMTDAERLEAMTRGLVNEMDSPYTMYLTAEQNQQIEESMSGDYSGIGAFVGLNKEGLVEITEIIENSPAEAAGIKVGDQFVAVDGTDVTGFNDITAVAALVRGEPGTTVDLTFYRPSINDTVDITATRARITSASVAQRMLTEDIGYIQIREFSSNVSKNFESSIKQLTDQGASHFVIDLRNNTGGYANEVVAMLDYLLPKATLATLKGRNEGEPFVSTWDSDKFTGVPDTTRYAILVNGITASASELFSGCLRDYDKAVLIGEQTFGKGSGTITITLDDGSAINVTNFLYYLPSDESIEGVGLEPDQVVELPEEAQGQSISQLTLEQDTQLSAAIEYLKSLQ